MSVAGCGDVIVNDRVGSVSRKLKLQNFLHVPIFKHSPLSVKVMDYKGLQTIFANRTCKASPGDRIVMTGKLVYFLYALDMIALTRRKNRKSFFVTFNI